MRNKAISIALLAGILSVLMANVASAVTLTLYVHEGSDSGPIIAGAVVMGWDAAYSSFNQTTNSSGYVTIAGTPGTWQFSVSKSGYETVSWSQSITHTQTRHAFLQVQRPDPPTLISPSNGATVSLTPTFRWSSVSNADYYAIAIRKDPPNGPIVYNPQQVYGTSHTVPIGVLENGHEYRWNMQAHNSAGWSAVSGTLYFQTLQAPLPDLVVNNIWTDPDPPLAADYTTIAIQIKNQGNSNATGTFFLEYYFDTTYIGHVYIDGLAAGSSYTSYWYAQTWPSDTNTHILKGVVDPDNTVSESNENNNELPKPFAAKKPFYTLTININGQGYTNPSQGTHTYEEGTQVTVNANPATNWKFGHWSGDASGTNTSVTITMNSNMNVTAHFTSTPPPPQPTPTISRSPTSLSASCQEGQNASPDSFELWNSGSGTLNYTISDDVGWLSCSPTNGNSTGEHDTINVNYSTSSLSADYYSATITISDLSATNDPQTISVSLTTAVTKYTLTASVVGGHGVISSAGGTYDAGTEVTLTATPDAGYRVYGWSGYGASPVYCWPDFNTVTVTMISDKTITVSFAEAFPILTTNVSPEGSGSVSPSSGSYDAGTDVTLTAYPNSGWEFDYWGGDASGTNTSVTITMNSNKNVTAYFTSTPPPPQPHTLTISSTSGGSVTVPGEGSFEYDHGQSVSIGATADSSFHFVNWTGSAVDAGKVGNPSSASTTVTVDADYTLQANFEFEPEPSTIDLPTVSTLSATDEGETSARLWGRIDDDGGDACQYRFRYKKSEASYTYTDWAGSVTTGQSFTQDITGLSLCSTYYFSAQVKNSAGESSWGTTESFTTGEPGGEEPAGSPPSDDYFLGDQKSLTGSSSDPVNTATGNLIHEVTDLSIPSRGRPLAFGRFYNSKDESNSPLGPGWTHSYNIVLSVNPNNWLVSVQWADGSTDYWYSNGQGGYEPHTPGLYDTLLQNTNSTWTVIKKNLDVYNFNALGRLKSIIGKNGNTFTLTYEQPTNPDLLTSVIDPAGRALILSYNEDGLLTSVSDFASPPRVVTYSYITGRLTQVTDVLNNTIEYTYDPSGYLETIVDQRGVTTVTNTYDGQGRVIEQLDGNSNKTTFAYDIPEPNQTTITDPNGNITIHTHSPNYKLLQSIEDSLGHIIAYSYDENINRTAITDRNGNSTCFSYDTRGNVIEKTDPNDPTDAHDGGVTTVEYNDSDFPDLPTKKIDALSNVWRYEYDANGNLTRQVDPNGNEKTWTYNNFGEKLTQTDENSHTTNYIYDTDGLLTEIIDPNGNHTWYGYDELWRLISITDGRGSFAGDPDHTTTTAYDDADRVISVSGPITGRSYQHDEVGNRTQATNRRDYTTVYEYDNNNNLTRIELPASSAQTQITEYTYDKLDRKISKIDGRGNMTTYEYDAAGRLIKKTNPEGDETSYAYDVQGNLLSITDGNDVTTFYEYDSLNRKIHQYEELGNHWYWQYDKLGQLIKHTDAAGHLTRYGYDELRRLISVTDDANNITEYEYDTVGNLIAIIDASGKLINSKYYDKANRLIRKEDGLGNAYEYTYDGAENIIAEITPNGDTKTYVYDNENRLTEIHYPDSSQVTYSYDDNGNLISMTDPAGTTTYVYDELDRLISSTDSFGKTVQYSYDIVGNRTSITYPADSNNPARIVTYTYDKASRLDKIIDWVGRTWDYDTDGAGRITSLIYPNGVKKEQLYDSAGRLSALSYLQSDESEFISFEYTRDGQGNPINISEHGTLLSSNLNSLNIEYTYDENNRLISSMEPAETYSYDNSSNIIYRTGDSSSIAFTYDNDNRLVSSTEPAAYSYDNNGNMTSRVLNLSSPPSLSLPSLSEALDTALSITTGGSANWFSQTTTSYYDGDAAQSGAILDRQESWMQTMVSGKGTVKFYWKVSSEEDFDFLEFYIDGSLQDRISGSVNWQQKTYTISTSGSHTLEWRYVKDWSRDLGSDCGWVDKVEWVPTPYGVTTTFSYDYENRFVSQITNDSAIKHIYNSLGNRIARNDNGSLTRYVLDRGRSMSHVLCETDDNGDIIAYYIHGPQIIGRIAADNSVRYYHTNHIGSVVALTDETGTITDRYAYTPFGVSTGKEGDTKNPFTFVGGLGVMEEADGLYFVRARFYDPSIGRFINKDFLQGILSQTQSLHRYAYSFNNPIKFIDPLGLSTSDLAELLEEQGFELPMGYIDEVTGEYIPSGRTTPLPYPFEPWLIKEEWEKIKQKWAEDVADIPLIGPIAESMILIYGFPIVDDAITAADLMESPGCEDIDDWSLLGISTFVDSYYGISSGGTIGYMYDYLIQDLKEGSFWKYTTSPFCMKNILQDVNPSLTNQEVKGF